MNKRILFLRIFFLAPVFFIVIGLLALSTQDNDSVSLTDEYEKQGSCTKYNSTHIAKTWGGGNAYLCLKSNGELYRDKNDMHAGYFGRIGVKVKRNGRMREYAIENGDIYLYSCYGYRNYRCEGEVLRTFIGKKIER